MNPNSHPDRDRRGALLDRDEIRGWFDLPLGFKAGLVHGGEFRMGADFGHMLILGPDGLEWINFGFYPFYFPSWNAGGVTSDGWNNPVTVSPDGNYLVLNWLYAHRHSAMSPVLIHLPSRTHLLVEPQRILTATAVSNAASLTCGEILWTNSARADQTVEITPALDLHSIEEFFRLDPFEIDTKVYSWKEGVLQTEPVRNYRGITPSTVKEREEWKRDRVTHPVDRWRYMKEIADWVKSGCRS